MYKHITHETVQPKILYNLQKAESKHFYGVKIRYKYSTLSLLKIWDHYRGGMGDRIWDHSSVSQGLFPLY